MTEESEQGRIAVVQTTRFAEVWRTGVPSDQEIERARRRFGQRRAAPRRAMKLVFVALIQGFVLGLGTLAAASWFVSKVLFAPAAPPKEPVLALSPKTSVRHVGGRTRAARAPEPPPLPAPSAAFDDARSRAEAPIAPPLPAPDVSSRGATPDSKEGEAAAASPAEPAPGASTRSFAESSKGTFPLTPLPEIPSAEGPWTRVAEALAAGDQQKADVALETLSTSSDAATRDAAELARAELAFGRGAGGPFRPSLERLSTSGESPLIRRRAAALLARMHPD